MKQLNTMPTTEQKAFSERLAEALNVAGMQSGPTALARAFNAFSGTKPVTVHAVRKWLVGEAIPTQDKLLALASMVGADPKWLRFGGDAPEFTPIAGNIEQREACAAVMTLAQRELRAVLALVRSLRGTA